MDGPCLVTSPSTISERLKCLRPLPSLLHNHHSGGDSVALGILCTVVFSWDLGPRREAGDVWCLPPVWNLRAVIWFHPTVSCLVLLPSAVTLSVSSLFLPSGPFSWTFSRKFFNIFRYEIVFFLYGSCLAARRNKLVGGMYSMLPYGTDICCYAFMFYYFDFFVLFLSIDFFLFSFLKSSIDKSTEWSMIPECPSITCFLFLF